MGEGDDGDEDADDASAPTNRAERRRKAALRRRAAKEGKPIPVSDDELPERDRNRRARQAMLAKRRQASDDDEDDLPAELTAGEFAQDKLARGSDAFFKWCRSNWKVLQWVIVGVIVVGAGSLVFVYRQGEASAAASDAYFAGVEAEQGVVIKPKADKRSEDAKKSDKRRIFPSDEARQKAALSSYDKVISEKAGSAAAILGQLGKAGVLLEQRAWDKAIAAYQAVLKTEMATDADVKNRSLEGIGFAQEGQKKLKAATATFEKLLKAKQPTFRMLGQYHLARVLKAEGKVDEAKKKLVAARKKLEKLRLEAGKDSSGSVNPYRYLSRAVDDALRLIDPKAVPPKVLPGSLGGGGGLSPAQLQQMLQQRGLKLPGGLKP